MQINNTENAERLAVSQKNAHEEFSHLLTCKLTRNNKYVPVLFPIVAPVATGTVSYSETGRLFAYQHIFPLVFI